ncbi:MAG: single-stranded DNA-binding protein [Verrucomicrobiota bacterium]
MASFNKVILLGNLTRDPEMRVTPGGLSICKLGLAVNRNFTTKDGEKREEVTYVDIDAFGRQAEVIAKYLSKGRSIFVEGRLKLDEWEDKNSGQKRSKLGVVLENFQFVGGRGEDGGGSGGYERSSPPARTTGRSAPAAEPEMEDDVPF